MILFQGMLCSPLYFVDNDYTHVARRVFRRFEMYILPKGFTKIRHYGFMQNHGKRSRLEQIRQCLQLKPITEIVQLPAAIRMLEKYGKDIFKCPCCTHGCLRIINTVRYFKTKTQDIKEIDKIINAKNKASPFG
jgi:hypothetical protein